MPNVTVSGLNLHYFRTGSGPPLLFLHGLFSDHTMYERLLELLSRRYTVYAVDLPGHGQSGFPTQSISLDQIAQLLAQFARRLKLEEPVLVGHSAGAAIAIAYARKTKVKRMVLLCPAGFLCWPGPVLAGRILIKNVVTLARAPRSARIIARSALQMLSSMRSKAFRRSLRGGNGTVSLEGISCPILTVLARDDLLFPEERMRSILSHSCAIVTVDGPHDVPVLDPGAIASLIPNP